MQGIIFADEAGIISWWLLINNAILVM